MPDKILKKIIAIIVAIMCIGITEIYAYDWIYRPSLRVNITWDDNIEDEPTDQKEDFFLGVTPRLILEGKGVRSSLTLDGSVTGEVYRDFEEFNDLNDYRLRARYRFDPSEVMFINVLSRFFFTTSASERVFRETIEGEEGAPTETAVITRRADRYRFNFDPSVTYSFSERFSTKLSGEFRTTQYTEDIPGISESTTYSLAGEMDYDFTRRTLGGIGVNYDDTDYEEGNDSKTYTTFLKVLHQFTRNITMSAAGGISYLTQDEEDNRLYYIGSAQIRLTFEKSVYRIGYNRLVQEGEFGDTTTTDRFNASATFPLTRRLDLGIAGAIYKNKSSDGDTDTLTKRIGFDFEYKPLNNLSLFISGSHEDQDERAVAGEDVRANTVSAGFVLYAAY